MRGVLILTYLLISGAQVFATHLIGGSMSYQYLGPNSRGNYAYKVTLSIYRDCQQSSVQFDPKIKLGVYYNNSKLSKFKTYYINLVSKKLVNPPGNTQCLFKPDVCIEEGFYEGVIEVEPSTVGYHLTFVRCCRNIQNNLTIGSNGTPDQGQTYYCFIPPTSINNSSPVFKGVPSPYMCANDTTAFLNTALDPDGDSLVYYFVKPFEGGSLSGIGSEPDPPPFLTLPISTVKYKSGFNENIPFGSSGFSDVDRFNGLTRYFTTTTGNYVVAIEVAEYRNGVLLSTVRLDLQIIFINCPPNQKPSITSDKGKSFEIEAGSKLCFNVISVDPDNDNLKLTPVGDIFTGANGWKGPKATLSAKTGKGTVVSEFCWQTSCSQANTKPYQFAVKVEDDGCPGKYNAVNFTIKVLPFISNIVPTGPGTVCQNDIASYTATNIGTKTFLEWEAVNGQIISGVNAVTVRVKWTGTGTGKIRLRESSQYGCNGDWRELTVTINQSPATPVISGPDTVCLGSTGIVYGIQNFTTGLVASWVIKTGTLATYSNNVITANWPVRGDQVIKTVMVNANGCKSDTGYKKVNVRKPIPDIQGPASVCPNSRNIVYTASGVRGSSYTWSISGGSLVSPSGTGQIRVNWGNQGTGTISVTETDRFGCTSDPVNYTVKKTYILDAAIPFGRMSVCEFEKGVVYSIFPSAGSTYNWTLAGGTVQPPTNTNTIKVDWGKAGFGKVTIITTAWDSVNNLPCTSLPGTLNVLINPTPSANTIEGPVKICQSTDSVSYTLRGFSGSKYRWTVDGNASGISGQGSSTIRMAWNKPGNYVLSVIELSKDSCLGNLVDTLIVVYPKPVSDLISGPKVVCDPDFANRTYSVSGFPGSTYSWVVQNGSISSGQGTGSVTVTWDQKEPAWLKAVEISDFGCPGDTIFQEITLDKLDVEMLVVSVGTPDDRIEVSWKNLGGKPYPRVYDLKRRKAGDLVWTDIATITDFTSYIDQPVNADANAFEYQVKVKDLCGVEKTSDDHTDVWLFGSKTEDPYEVKLDFTNYIGFKNGVQKYVIYRSVAGISGYQPYDSMDQPAERFYKNGLEGYLQCYRILSLEKDGNLEKSWSNEVCFNFAPSIYVPNAFTPNGDGINDQFEIVSGAIKTYEMKVFDRWGERLWSTNDPNEFWDGTYQGKTVQMDVYMYVIDLTDFRDKKLHLNGTVHVIH